MTYAIYEYDTNNEIVGQVENIHNRKLKKIIEELINNGASNYYITSFEEADCYCEEEGIECECEEYTETMNLDEYLRNEGKIK